MPSGQPQGGLPVQQSAAMMLAIGGATLWLLPVGFVSPVHFVLCAAPWSWRREAARHGARMGEEHRAPLAPRRSIETMPTPA